MKLPRFCFAFTVLLLAACSLAQEKTAWRQGYEGYLAWMSTLGIDAATGEKEMMAWAQATNDFRRGRRDAAIPVALDVLQHHPNSEVAGDALWMVAQAQLDKGKTADGIASLRRLLSTYSSPAWLQAATERLVAELSKSGDKKAAADIGRDFARRWPDSRVSHHLLRLTGLDSSPEPDPAVANEAWKRILAVRDETRWGDEEGLLRQYVAEFPESPHWDDALAEQMRVYRNHIEPQEREVRYLEELLKRKTPMPGMDLAMVGLAQRYIQRGSDDKGAALLERLAKWWPNSVYTPKGLIDAALARMARGDGKRARQDLDMLSLRGNAPGSFVTFDPYLRRDIQLVVEYFSKPSRDWPKLLDAEHRVIENPATSIPRRAEAQARADILNHLVLPNRDPKKATLWSVRLFIFTKLDHEWTTKSGEKHHAQFQLSQPMIDDIKMTFEKYKEDIFRYSRGGLRIESETRIVDENARVEKVDWNPSNPDMFWKSSGHPLEKVPNRTAGPFLSDFWIVPSKGLPAWAPAGAGGPDKETGRGEVSFFYEPTWKDWFRYVMVHEWSHHIDSAFWLNGWKPQWNLSHDHCGRGWESRWPDKGDPDWIIGFVKGLGDPEDEWCPFYRWVLECQITPRMWAQAKLEGIHGEDGAKLP